MTLDTTFPTRTAAAVNPSSRRVSGVFVLLLFSSGLFCGPRTVDAQSPRPRHERLLSVDALHEDLKATRSLLERMHPGLHLYVNADELGRKFDAVEAAIVEPLTAAEFLVKLASPIESIRCGHTYLMLPPGQMQMLHQRGRMFPLPIVFLEGTALVDHKKAALPLGAEILSINGVSMDDLVELLQPLVPCDGFVANSRLTNLAVEFADAYAIGVGQRRSFRVTYRLHDAQDEETKTIDPVSGRSLQELNESRFSRGGDRIPLDFKKLRNDTVLLTINSLDFDDYRRGNGMFRHFLKRSFGMIAMDTRVTNVVLDLRKNDGGYTSHEILLHSYLASKPFHEMRTAETRTITIAEKHLLDPDWYSRGLTRYLERRLSKEFDPAGDHLFTVDEDSNPAHEPHRLHFEKTLYVMTSGRTHSAAASLCSMLDRKGKTIFVGEETGGVRSTFTAGNILGYLLPNSHLQLAVPIIQYHFREGTRESEPGHGVIPHHPVVQSREDFIGDKDRVLERVLELITQDAGP